ncbi:MAG: S66 peptidase family protein [Adhaeribacter sp.]
MPAPLRPGDKIAIVALARKINLEDIQPAIVTFQSWGLEVVLGKTLSSQYHIFAGTDQERAADLQLMLDRPDIKAVISARGGYGSARLLELVDFSQFALHPKWVIGFSDITALLAHIQKMGIACIHGIMPTLFSKPGSEAAKETLRQALFGERVVYPSLPAHALNREGQGQGELTGGNVSLLASVIGTPSEVDFSGKILFIEEVEEYLYSLDRLLVHLKRSGKLTQLAGLVVGHMTQMQDNAEPFGKTAQEIVWEHTQSYAYPVAFGFPTGHEEENLALVCGRVARLEVTAAGATLRYLEKA